MSYGTAGGNGLRPARRNGANNAGSTTQYNIASAYATNLFQFDPIVGLADGTVGIGVAGTMCRGTMEGCKYTDTTGTLQFRNYWPASTSVLTGTVALALVNDDPNLIFDMQEATSAGAAGTPLALADRNLNINFAIPAGSTRTGMSAAVIDNGTEANTSTLNLKIIDLSPVPGNVVGSFANWLVMWNSHELRSVGQLGT